MQHLSHAPDLEQISRYQRSALQSAAAIGEPACVSDQEEGSDAGGSDDDSLSVSHSETETVTPADVTHRRQITLFEWQILFTLHSLMLHMCAAV
ncbi:hypothetical protein NDU88_001838 [Pleurodeles waltl]|uniref:Uncharacterized protein n=1 Tax=Pleurodeles waltl TaxID=8319 RepID=A0AAV7RB21_PLEWA|nr:hypothetical protein NDU88_001838 [Pleurodeles waltl]